jgi:opacity protein-like surface antigen
MKNFRNMVLSAVLVVAAAASAQAQSATQDITISVQAINKIAISGGAHTMTINTATAGQAPDDVVWSTSWDITTNQTGSKVVAAIGSDMPSGVTLKVNMAEPTNATSAGDVSLTSTPQELVTGISKLNESALGITYTASATALAGVQTVARTVTYTITGGV